MVNDCKLFASCNNLICKLIPVFNFLFLDSKSADGSYGYCTGDDVVE